MTTPPNGATTAEADAGKDLTLTDLVEDCVWVAWRNESRNGKMSKMPYAGVGRQAKSDDRETWLRHDTAAIIAAKINNNLGGGVGLMLGACDDTWLAGVDLDTCRDPRTGVIEPWATKVMRRLASYTEVSPSGTGAKVFFVIDPANIAAVRGLMRTDHGKQFKRANGDGAHPPAIELYVSNRYFAVTWQGLDDYPSELRRVPLEDLRWLIEDAGPTFARKKANGKARAEDAKSNRPSDGDDDAAGTADAGDILAKLDQLAHTNRAVATALTRAATMHGGSRSEGAMGLGAALQRAGWSYAEGKAALLACPVTREWASEKHAAEGERQFQRIWDKAAASNDAAGEDGDIAWPTPVDFFVDQDAAPPELKAEHVPDAIWEFSTDTAERMGGDPTGLALGGLVSCASVISDTWRIQPKRKDTAWTENARLWGAIVGDPSILKTPRITACTKPIERLDAEARERHKQEMADHKVALASWKASKEKDPGPEPTAPKLARYLIEGATVEAISEALRDAAEARQYAPARKVLSRHDEMSEFFANLDRYKAGGRGGGDRGAYLRLYNGGRYTIDRIARGSFTVPNWSACFFGGIQPGPIQKIAKDAADDGLLQRFMYDVPGPQQPGVDRAPDRDAIERYYALFPRLAAMQPPKLIGGTGSNVVVLHERAHQHREDIDALARALAALPDTSPRLKATLGKWSGLFARLCLTFHLIDLADATPPDISVPYVGVVSQETARRVAGFMYEIVLPHLLRAEALMFGTEQSGHAKWIAGFILAHRLDRITSRDVVRAYRDLRPPEARDELASVMANLVTVGWLEPEVPQNQVKPVWAWRVNPSVHVMFEDQAARERERREKAKANIAADIAVLRQKRREAQAQAEMQR